VENQAKIHFQKSIWDFKPPIKSYRQILEGGWKGHFFWQFQTSSLKFVYNFWLEAWNLKRVFRNESWLDFSPSLVQSILKKNYSTMPKWGLNFYLEDNSYVLTIMSGQALIFQLSHTLWVFMMENGFYYKKDLSTLYSYQVPTK